MVVLAVVAGSRNGVLVARSCNIGRFLIIGARCLSSNPRLERLEAGNSAFPQPPSYRSKRRRDFCWIKIEFFPSGAKCAWTGKLSLLQVLCPNLTRKGVWMLT